MDAISQIAVIEAKSAASGVSGLENRLLAAMRATRNHWLLTDDNRRFNAAVAAVSLLSDDGDRRRILQEAKGLSMLQSALSQDMPVDLDELCKLKFEPIGLLNLWRRVGTE